jgi:membrane protein YqaA with SNARE-associated domain
VLRRLYDWIMRLASGPNAGWALAAVAFIESSVFPIPPDVLLIPMVIAAPRRAWRYAAIATLASVAGGYLGYAIGYFAFATIGRAVLDFYHAMPAYERFKAAAAEWGAWVIILKGMTPIPYKLVTIASGFAGYNLELFVLLSIITRGARFSLEAGLLYIFGEPVRGFIEKRLEIVFAVFLIVLVAGFLIAHYAF